MLLFIVAVLLVLALAGGVAVNPLAFLLVLVALAVFAGRGRLPR